MYWRALAAMSSGLISIILAVQPVYAESNETPARPSGSRPPASPVGDPVLHWNALALQANAEDHSGTFGAPQQGGPGPSSRALAIVHAAVFDAVNSIDGSYRPYLTRVRLERGAHASIDAAVATAAHDTLTALYPAQQAVFDDAWRRHLALLRASSARDLGVQIGRKVAERLLASRRNDGANAVPDHTASDLPGRHRVDPFHPSQGYLGPHWGAVRPFVIRNGAQFRSPPPPLLHSRAYAEAFNDAKRLGGNGVETATQRTVEQTEIGLYWAYDGGPGLGTPPRLYNQITRAIAEQMSNTVVENARLFALVNLAQADAGIACWESKYHYDFWRPILGIQEADRGTGPTGEGDHNRDTRGDTHWHYLGAPASNQIAGNFTPPFPAYPSGHATFGAATFESIALFYGTDDIPFTFTSDELNGLTTDNQGTVRPLSPRSYLRLSDAAAENAQSRIYLGIHWQFDATEGIVMGSRVANYVFRNALRPAR